MVLLRGHGVSQTHLVYLLRLRVTVQSDLDLHCEMGRDVFSEYTYELKKMWFILDWFEKKNAYTR